MANKKSDNLFRLVHSLTKAEKRYFTIYTSHHIIGEKNSYFTLFNVIDKQQKFDDEELFRLVKHQPFAKRLSLTKNRLYTAILHSLDSFYANTSAEMQAKRLVESAAILYRKSLYDQCKKVLHQARKIAAKNELPLLLSEIGRWEKKLVEKNGYEGISAAELKRIYEDDQKNSQQIQRQNQLWNVKSNLFLAMYHSGKVRSEAELAEFKMMIDEIAADGETQFSDTENIYLWNHLRSAYYFGIGDYTACYPCLKKLVALSEKKPAFFALEPGILPSVLSNAVYVGIALGKKKEAYSWFEKLKKFTAPHHDAMTPDAVVKMFSLRASTELMLYIKSEDYERGLAALPTIEEGLKKFDSSLNGIRKTHLLFNMTVILFNSGKFHEALHTLNRVLNMPDADKRTDIFCMCQVLNLIIHFELGNTDLLKYTLKTAKRYLVSRKKVYRFETTMLTFINEMIKKRRTKSDAEMFEELALELQPLLENRFESTVFEYFDFIGWAKSKSNQREENKRAA